MSASPPVRPPPRGGGKFDPNLAGDAIATAAEVLRHLVPGPILVSRSPRGDVCVDVPLMYDGFALDRMHFDPVSGSPLPKGKPSAGWGGGVRVDERALRSRAEEVIRELRVIGAAEYRDPEDSWAVPVAWESLIVAHIKVSYDGSEVVPDYGLTGEVMRYVP